MARAKVILAADTFTQLGGWKFLLFFFPARIHLDPMTSTAACVFRLLVFRG